MNGVEVVASWFTPTVLFCVLNLVIGTIFITSTLKPPHTHSQNNGEQPPHPPQLLRVPSFFERVKSFNQSRYHQSSLPDPAINKEELHHHVTEETTHHVTRSKTSDAVAAAPKVAPAEKALKKEAPAAKVLEKSASERMSTEKEVEEEERRRPATVRARRVAEDEAVDEKADDFINRFRQQLKLQRLDSLLRYRGAGT